MFRWGFTDLYSRIANGFLDEFREQVPRPIRLALVALAIFVALGLGVSSMPGAQMIRGSLGLASADAASISIRDAANDARARRDRAELRTSRATS
jgi:hypothetical protein